MKKWKCNYCFGYIPIDFSKLPNNELVDFKISSKMKVYSRKGRILSRLNNKYFIVSGIDFFLIEHNLVYPRNAPAKLIYNMFWLCNCNDK